MPYQSLVEFNPTWVVVANQWLALKVMDDDEESSSWDSYGDLRGQEDRWAKQEAFFRVIWVKEWKDFKVKESDFSGHEEHEVKGV